ncbi:MAG: hypothetical protein ABEI52_08670, partial [Halobacteriaceae archaeon]
QTTFTGTISTHSQDARDSAAQFATARTGERASAYRDGQALGNAQSVTTEALNNSVFTDVNRSAQDAVDAAESNNGGVVILTKRDIISSPIRVSDPGIHIFGYQGAAEIKASSSVSHLIRFENDASNSIDNCSLQGVFLNGQDNVTDSFIDLQGLQHGRIRNVEGANGSGASFVKIRPKDGDTNFVRFENIDLSAVDKAVDAVGTGSLRSFTDCQFRNWGVVEPNPSDGDVFTISDVQKSTFQGIYVGSTNDYTNLIHLESPNKSCYLNQFDYIFTEVDYASGSEDSTVVDIDEGSGFCFGNVVRRVGGFDGDDDWSDGTLVHINGGKHNLVEQVYGVNVTSGNAGGAVTIDDNDNRIETGGIPPGAVSDVVLDNGLRNLINGVGSNGGDPSGTGVWNGNGAEGVIVRDTNNSNTYIYNNGTWSQIAST